MKAEGGGDLAEDVLGALTNAAGFNWKSSIRFMIMIGDAPGHGRELHNPDAKPQYDRFYYDGDPLGLSASSVIDTLEANEIDLVLCHLGGATRTMGQVFQQQFAVGKHKQQMTEVHLLSGVGKPEADVSKSGSFHVIFCLDESGSMMGKPWNDLMDSYRGYIDRRIANQGALDVVSVITFNRSARLQIDAQPISTVAQSISYSGGGTAFAPPLNQALKCMNETKSGTTPLLVFMSDGCCCDENPAINTCQSISNAHRENLQVHCVGFGSSCASHTLSRMATVMGGDYHSAADANSLNEVFTHIAAECNVADQLVEEVGKRISDSVCDKLEAEYA